VNGHEITEFNRITIHADGSEEITPLSVGERADDSRLSGTAPALANEDASLPAAPQSNETLAPLVAEPEISVAGPEPEPEPAPIPVQDPAPEPEPAPIPVQDPVPEPEPAPIPVQDPLPEPAPELHVPEPPTNTRE
jgi:hypothetical protein